MFISGLTLQNGGSAVRNTTSDTVTIANSRFLGNGTGAEIESTGGIAVANSTLIGNDTGVRTIGSGGVTVTNSTIASGLIDGVVSSSGAVVTVTNSTITGNPRNGIIVDQGSKVTLTNSIVAGNGTDLSDPSNSITTSLSIVGGTPLLGTLGNYGGPTQTIPLLPGSPANGTGDPTVCAAIGSPAAVGGKDQRGISRPANSCDAGAFQSQGFTLAKVSGDTLHAEGTASADVTVLKRPTVTSVRCVGPRQSGGDDDPGQVQAGQQATCTITVRDIGDGTPTAPTGTVSVASSGAGTLNGSPCTLIAVANSNSAARSTVTFTPGAAGTQTLTATYGGYATHGDSKGTGRLEVSKPGAN